MSVLPPPASGCNLRSSARNRTPKHINDGGGGGRSSLAARSPAAIKPRRPSLGISTQAFCLPCPRALVKTFLIMINYTGTTIPPFFTKYTNNRRLSLNTALFIHLSAAVPAERVPHATMFFIVFFYIYIYIYIFPVFLPPS